MKTWILQKFKILRDFIKLEKDTSQSIEEVEAKKELPLEYASRFESFAIQSAEQLLGRKAELELINIAYLNWKITKENVLVVGETGLGITSYLQSATCYFPKARFVGNQSNLRTKQDLIDSIAKCFGLSDIESNEQLKESIIEQELEDQVIVFENLERIFLRKIGGFEILNEFLLIMHELKNYVFWVIAINSYSLYYLDSVMGISTNFTNIIRLKPIKKEDILDIFWKRNDGYKVHFLKPDSFEKKKLKKMNSEEKQKTLEESFFNELAKYSKGNIARALIFMRESAIRVTDESVYIKSYERNVLPKLDLNELFLLEAIMQHSSLAQKELKDIFRNATFNNRLAVQNLLEKNLIGINENNEYYINMLYYNTLKERVYSRLNRNFQ